MKKKAIISIVSNQDKDNDAVEVVTPGDFYKKDDSYYAVYKETEISGMEGTTTTLKIETEKLSLIRMGTTSTKMEFEKNSEKHALYNTPYGTLEIKIDTKVLDISVDENGGNVFIQYLMSLSGQKSQDTTLKISIKTNEKKWA